MQTTRATPLHNKSWLTPTTRCVTSSRHRAVCDQQVTVVGRLLTTLGDHQCFIVKLFLFPISKNKLCLFLEIFKFCISLINILQLQGLCPQTRSYGSSGGMTLDPMHWPEVLSMQ